MTWLLLVLLGCGAPPEPSPAGPGPVPAAGTPAPPLAPSEESLVGTDWVLQRIGHEAVPAGAEATLAFADSALSGRGGCNRLFARYTAESGGFAGPLFHVEDLLGTEMHCGPLQTFEDRYFDALRSARRWLIDADTLELAGAGPTLTFRRGG